MALPVRKGYKGAPAQAVLTNSPTSGDTSFVVDTVTGWATTFPFYCVVDPGTSKEEKVKVTAISTLTLTVVRAQDDTTASGHNAGAAIYPVFTADEADEANLIASVMTTKGDVIGTDGSSINRLGIGTNTHVLQADSTSTNGFKWGQVATAGIADGAVTSAKILDSTIVLGDLAAALVTYLVPVGTINAYAGSTAPDGWLLCNGDAFSSATYPALYSVLGNVATTPDMRGLFPMGKTAAGTGSTLRGTGGSNTITIGNLPSHNHVNTLTDPGHTHTQIANYGGTPGGTVGVALDLATDSGEYGYRDTTGKTTGVTITNAYTGSGTAYFQPFIALNYIIKY